MCIFQAGSVEGSSRWSSEEVAIDDKDKFAPTANEAGLRCFIGVIGPEQPIQNEYKQARHV